MLKTMKLEDWVTMDAAGAGKEDEANEESFRGPGAGATTTPTNGGKPMVLAASVHLGDRTVWQKSFNSGGMKETIQRSLFSGPIPNLVDRLPESSIVGGANVGRGRLIAAGRPGRAPELSRQPTRTRR